MKCNGVNAGIVDVGCSWTPVSEYKRLALVRLDTNVGKMTLRR